jgi:signal transduction histidine kinase
VLVGAVKGFTHMDQAAVPEPVDVAKGIDDTVTVLRSKARSKSASITVEVEPGLPKARGFVGELNQIWANLIDNALDAIPDSGHIDVRATRERHSVVVRITDNGSGIGEEIRDRIFEPFFSTKPVGHGTGLGLDIVRRLVRNNNGDVSVESQPGRTEFRVELPVVSTGGGAAS